VQPDQQLISQLEEAVGSARRTLDETKRQLDSTLSVYVI
jgi:flagellar biosynthesis chaperone FliJ